MISREITTQIESLADPKVARRLRTFFKTGKGQYAFGDRFLGVRTPVLRKLVKKYEEAPLAVAEKLLRSEWHEIRLFALLFWVIRFSKAFPEEQENIYRLYLKHRRRVNNWDLVDLSAHHIVGAHLERRSKKVLIELIDSKWLWDRRIAIVSTFYFIKQNHFTQTLRLSKKLLNDREDLMHKAAGWMLREVGKRDLEILRAFLDAHCRAMPRTMLRYAIEKMAEEERQRYLKGG
jgi:3-methyladenine DNA glycosylase AlkD